MTEENSDVNCQHPCASPRNRVAINAGRLWGGGLATAFVAALVATTVLPFALDGSLQGKVCAAVINLVIGLSIASLLSAVLSRTVVDAERSWQQP